MRAALRIALGALVVGLVAALVLALLPAATVDRSSPVVAQAVAALSRLTVAQGRYSTLVDVERGQPGVPSWLSGERTTLFAEGEVIASVDLDALTSDDVEVSLDRSAVTVTLPAVVLGAPRLDPAQTKVVGRQRGLAQRLAGAVSELPDDAPLYAAASARIAAAAVQSDLDATGRASATATVTRLLTALGFTEVRVAFEDAP